VPPQPSGHPTRADAGHRRASSPREAALDRVRHLAGPLPHIIGRPMTKATARWTGTKVGFEVRSESGHTADIDEGPPYGDDAAMRPTEMLLGTLGSCTGINVVLLLKKYKQPLRSLEVEVEGE